MPPINSYNSRRSVIGIGLPSNIIPPVPKGVIKDNNSDGSDLREIAGFYRSNFSSIVSQFITSSAILSGSSDFFLVISNQKSLKLSLDGSSDIKFTTNSPLIVKSPILLVGSESAFAIKSSNQTRNISSAFGGESVFSALPNIAIQGHIFYSAGIGSESDIKAIPAQIRKLAINLAGESDFSKVLASTKVLSMAGGGDSTFSFTPTKLIKLDQSFGSVGDLNSVVELIQTLKLSAILAGESGAQFTPVLLKKGQKVSLAVVKFNLNIANQIDCSVYITQDQYIQLFTDLQ